VRGIGIMRLDALAEAPVAMIADLVASEEIERLPARRSERVLGLPLPRIAVTPFDASAAAKLRLALRAFTEPGLPAMIGE
jgi:hypothetical protein